MICLTKLKIPSEITPFLFLEFDLCISNDFVSRIYFDIFFFKLFQRLMSPNTTNTTNPPDTKYLAQQKNRIIKRKSKKQIRQIASRCIISTKSARQKGYRLVMRDYFIIKIKIEIEKYIIIINEKLRSPYLKKTYHVFFFSF